MKILLIEDTHSLSLLYQDYLGDLGATVLHASSAEAGLAILTQEKIDLLFLDLNLPGLDGLGMLQQMAADKVAIPPTIVITANDTIKTAVTAMQLGAKDYLIKPFTREKIIATAQKVLQQQAMANDMPALTAALRKPLI